MGFLHSHVCRFYVQLLRRIFFPLYAAGAWYFGAPKYPKRFVNPAMWLLTTHAHQKTAALCFVRFCEMKVDLAATWD